MDKKMKKVLEYMNAQEHASSRLYDFSEDLKVIASVMEADTEAARARIRYLEKYEYVTWIKDQNGRTVRFSLDYKGLNWRSYRREELCRYILENWIDFLAMLFALISLVLSLSNTFSSLPRT